MDKKLEIGLRLKLFVEKNFNSTAELARIFDKTRSYFNPYFNGTSVPGGEFLAKLGELGCDINWLLNGETTGGKQINCVKEKLSDYDMSFIELKSQIEELKEENKTLKAEIYDLQRERTGLMQKNAELLNEIEQLHKELLNSRESKQ